MLVYLAGPIDAIGRESAVGWRTAVAEELRGCGVAVFDPYSAFRNDTPWAEGAVLPSAVMDAVNRAAIRSSDVVLACLLEAGRAIGSCREIEYARSRGKRVVVAVQEPHRFCALHDCAVYPTLDEALVHLEA